MKNTHGCWGGSNGPGEDPRGGQEGSLPVRCQRTAPDFTARGMKIAPGQSVAERIADATWRSIAPPDVLSGQSAASKMIFRGFIGPPRGVSDILQGCAKAWRPCSCLALVRHVRSPLALPK
jgi:hypothetical protein